MWRSEEEARQSTYDCSYCIMRHLKEGRVCFRYDPVNTLNIPNVFDKAGNPKYEQDGKEIEGAYSIRKSTREDAMQLIAKISKNQPSRPVFDIWKSYFIRHIGTRWDEERKSYVPAEVCPIGFITEETEFLISMESASAKYNTLPYEGSWLDQPQFVLEAFESIQIAHGQFERDRINKMKRESRAAKAKGK